MSQPVPAQSPHPASLGQVHGNSVNARKRARSARQAATFTPIASDPPTIGGTAPSAATISTGWGLLWRGLRQGDHGMTGNPAASCAARLGSKVRISRFRSALALPHSAISASERPQPVQWPARASSAQISMQGDFQTFSRCSVEGAHSKPRRNTKTSFGLTDAAFTRTRTWRGPRVPSTGATRAERARRPRPASTALMPVMEESTAR